jgi:hypothetical protein
MTTETREQMIRNYIAAYNSFDVDAMFRDMDQDIVFENISNSGVTMVLTGFDAFKEQARHALAYFSERAQTILSFAHSEEETEVNIKYRAVLAIDFPNGMKKGDEWNMEGKSVFSFTTDKIIRLVDIS